MEQSLDTRVAVLEVRADGFDSQDRRIVSHVESEQRNTASNSKRIDALEKINDRQQAQVDKHDKILLNSGQGMSLRVDRLEVAMAQLHKEFSTAKEAKRDGFRWNVNTVLNILIALTSIVMTLLMYFKND